ncbi:hypothetical protein GQ55_5G333700 [Panicum hallii var. hallii]|uniref:Uncharacterized protein n=1 Tax=Panicum hallii var. hallii TaxID=1504633 RepID=A0A2T7DLX7_9POAL|nr:hypothetical protein GQ55_5G333700 [Panicum hallii var. hallii]
MRFVYSMVDHWSPVVSGSIADELVVAHAELAQMDAKFSILRSEFEVRETELVAKVQEIELQLANLRKAAGRARERGFSFWKFVRFFIYV